MSRNRKIIIAACAALLLAVGGVYAFILLRDDAPEALDTGDLDAALNATTVAGTDPSTTAAQATDTAAQATDTTAGSDTAAGSDTIAAAGAIDGVEGVWNITQESTLGYRVSEVLGGVDTEGAGRTTQVTGTLTIEATSATAAEFTVDMASITSDSDRRDGQFRDRIMSTDDFPTSTFVLTAPIDFGTIPADGEQITATATGELTLRGVTNPVTFEVTAQIDGGRLGVLGSIPVLFSEYEIPDPSNGFAVVKDNGLLEFVLVFERA